jgi:hypothetical protein
VADSISVKQCLTYASAARSRSAIFPLPHANAGGEVSGIYSGGRRDRSVSDASAPGESFLLAAVRADIKLAADLAELPGHFLGIGECGWCPSTMLRMVPLPRERGRNYQAASRRGIAPGHSVSLATFRRRRSAFAGR